MWADNETSEDLLGFKVHADLLIDVVDDEGVLPITIGIFGDWGSGKSSVLQIIRKALDQDNETLCIYFNGWTFEGYDDAKAALLNSILKELEDNKKLTAEVKATVKEKAKKLWKSVDWMRGAGMVLKNVALPAVAAYFTGGISLIPFGLQKLNEWGIDDHEKLLEKLKSDEGKEFLKSLIKETDQEDGTAKTKVVSEFRKDFTELIDATKFKKLVVIIDDLDRCTPERIIENLEAIKLFLNVPKTAFLIGADPRIVRHAIEVKYRDANKLDDENTRIVDDYLEKLIQLPYALPKLSEPEVETYISMLICKKEVANEVFAPVHTEFQEFRKRDRYSPFGLSNFETILKAEDFEKVKSNVITIPKMVPLITQSLYGNPRQIKRFLNTYTLRQRLANVASLSDFNDAVLAKLMILEYAEDKLFKDLFEWQLNQDGLPSQIKKLEAICFEKAIEEAVRELSKSDYKVWAKPKVVKWLQLEPRLSDIDLRDYFWISRDKISTSITAASLISPLVKTFFNEIAKELPATLTKSILKDKFPTLSPVEQDAFFKLLRDSLQKNPKEKRFYDIFNFFLDENIENSPHHYIETLKIIRQSDIEPAIATSLRQYKSHSEMGEFLADYFKDGKNRASKAFNLEGK